MVVAVVKVVVRVVVVVRAVGFAELAWHQRQHLARR